MVTNCHNLCKWMLAASSDGFLSNAKALWSTTNALPDSIAQSHRKPTRGRHLLSWQTNHVAFTSNRASCLQKQSAQLAHLHRFQQNAAGKSGHWQCKGLAQNWSGFALDFALASMAFCGILWLSMRSLLMRNWKPVLVQLAALDCRSPACTRLHLQHVGGLCQIGHWGRKLTALCSKESSLQVPTNQ